MYHLYHGLWGSGTSASLVPWFVGVWYECTTCTMVCGGLVRVHHLYHGLWGSGTSAPLVPGFVGSGTINDCNKLSTYCVDAA